VFKPVGDMPLHDSTKAGEFCWNELLTSDQAAAFGFYAELLDWRKIDEHDMGPMGKYLLFGVGDLRLGGMFTIPKGAPMPPSWCYYIQVPDLHAALDRAKARGAKVLNGPMEVPGGAHIVQLMDPQGAAFALHEEPKSA